MLRHRENQPGVRQLQSVEAGKQPWHSARRHQSLVKGPVGGFELQQRLGVVAFDQRQFDFEPNAPA